MAGRREAAGMQEPKTSFKLKRERMTDYYPVLLRAVAALEANTFEGRRAIYNHARAALIEQLDKRPFIKKDFDRERLMLEKPLTELRLTRRTSR
jgi:hypothetical protein